MNPASPFGAAGVLVPSSQDDLVLGASFPSPSGRRSSGAVFAVVSIRVPGSVISGIGFSPTLHLYFDTLDSHTV